MPRSGRVGWVGAMGTVLLSLPVGGEAFACPFCASETAERVRAGLFDADFASTAFGTLLPFPVLLAIVLLIYGPPRRVRRLGSPRIAATEARP